MLNVPSSFRPLYESAIEKMPSASPSSACARACPNTRHSLSLYSAAFYLVIAVLALLVTVGDLRRWLRPLLLVLGWVGLLISLVLATYSTVALRTLCHRCSR